MKWMSTGDLARLIEDHFPADEAKVRELCEEGAFGRYAKRLTRKAEGGEIKACGHWRIAERALLWILRDVFQLDEQEIAEVRAKEPKRNFKVA